MSLLLSLSFTVANSFIFPRLPDGVSGVPGVVNINVPNGGHPSGLPESGTDNKNVQGYCQVSWWSMHCRAIKANVR